MAVSPPGLEQALALHRQGRLDDAALGYEAVLRAHPKHFDALHFLGRLRFRQGRLDESQKLLRRALNQQPQSAEANHALGQVLAALGRFAEARARYERALAAKPDFAAAHNDLGIALAELGRTAESAESYRRAVALDPAFVAALSNLGLALQSQGREAEAIACFRQALAAEPGFAEASLNLGNTLIGTGEPAAALAAYESAVAHAPGDARMHNNLGRALEALGRDEAALAAYARAAALSPGYAGAQLNLALAHLAQGDFAAGWPLYEWRWRTGDLTPRALPAPLWTGAEELAGKTLFVYAEQGLGDTLHVARYVPLLAARGARVVFEAQRALLPLLASLDGVASLLAPGDDLPEIDLQIPLLSLPGAFATTLDTLPARVPYLAPPAERVARWRGEIEALARPRIGLAWAGSLANRNDRNRSLPLALLEPVLARPGASLVSLQKDLREGDAAILHRHPQVLPLGERLADFADTAAVMSLLDLVVSVDTAPAHLAGALARPRFLLLPFAGEWRWLRGRRDSPWYPTARLFRQPAPGDWPGAVTELMAALDKLSPTPDI